MFDISKIKYTKIEMNMALNEFVENNSDEKLDEITKMINDREITAAGLNIMAAEHNGISVSELIASPNMEKLMEAYSEYLLNKIYCNLIEMGMTEIQATGLIYFSLAGMA